jgi:hypothetical protein
MVKISYARYPTDVVTIALQTESRTEKTMGLRQYHYFDVALTCNRRKFIHVDQRDAYRTPT